MQLLTVVPVFASSDFDRTVAFYTPFGYREVVRYAQGYLILRGDGVELHFNTAPADHDPYKSVQVAYVRVLSMDSLRRVWADIGLPDTDIPRRVLPELRPWGMFEAHSVDPDGNLLIYGAAEETLDTRSNT